MREALKKENWNTDFMIISGLTAREAEMNRPLAVFCQVRRGKDLRGTRRLLQSFEIALANLTTYATGGTIGVCTEYYVLRRDRRLYVT